MMSTSWLDKLHDRFVVVTGAAGFLGRPLVTALAAAGARVLATGRGAAPAEFAAWQSVTWLTRDLAETGFAAEEIGGAEAVFHLAAAKALRAGEDEGTFVRANEGATISLLRALSKTKTRVIFASSQYVYGNSDSRAVTEETPLLGMTFTPYACSKLNAEHWVDCLQRRREGSALALRLSGFVEGGGNVDYMIARALRNEPIELFSGGEVCRDYLSLANGVEALLAAATADVGPGFRAFNIGSGQAITSFDVAALVVRTLASESEIIRTDTPAPLGDFVYDITRATTELGFVPAPLAESITAYARQQRATFLRNHAHG